MTGRWWKRSLETKSSTKKRSLQKLILALLAVFAVAVLGGCAGVVSAGGSGHTTISFQLTPASLSFGKVTVGTQSTQSITVSNTGNASLNITSAQLSNPQFSVNGMALPLALAAGQSAKFTVAVTPSAAGSLSGTLTVSGDRGTTPVVVNLSASAVSATGSQPALTVTPATANFGNVSVGSPSSQTVRLTNSGTAALTISQVSATGSGFTTGTFALPISLDANQSSSFNVLFSPTSAGTVSGSVSIVSNAPNSPATIALTGTGVPAAMTLSFSSTSLTFGNVITGSSATQTITATITGNSSVSISSIAENGTGFSLSGASTPVTLSAGQSLTFSVMFSPTAAGNDSGTVSVTSNASGSPVTISLSGSGVTVSTHTVLLNWVASTSAVTGYNVYRSTTNGSGYAKINSAPVAGLTYTDSSTLLNSMTYYYVTTAVDSNGNESAYSNQASAAIP